MKIVIPMAGRGKRFINAGYKTPKPLIPVHDKPIINHVVEQFGPSDDFVFGINEEHASWDIEKHLKDLRPNSHIISMPYDSKGVIPVVLRLKDAILDDEPTIVNYCDFSWVWDYKTFQEDMRTSNCDGAVICYRGFHPHLHGPNLYATCNADGLDMLAIQEKHTWHGNKELDWTSSGTYYFKKGEYISRYFAALEKMSDLEINGEHYVSQVFQLMKEDGLNIRIFEIPIMLQWGTPEDLQHYMYWSNVFDQKKSARPDESHDMTNLILAAGEGLRFVEAGYQDPKPSIEINNTPMLLASTQSLPQGKETIFITREGLLSSNTLSKISDHYEPPNIISLDTATEGQACTALMAEEKIPADQALLIASCDHELLYDAEKFKAMTHPDSDIDALIFTYRNNPNVLAKPNDHGWVQTNAKGKAFNVSVKKALQGNPLENHAVVGAFWFRHARDYFDHTKIMIVQNRRFRSEFYIDECMNGLIDSDINVHVFEVIHNISWGTPSDLKTYEYWMNYFHNHAPLLTT